MAKEIITTAVTFDPTAKTIDFSAWADFDINRLIAITNNSKNVLIYSIANNGTGLASIAGNLITLQYDTSAQDASDELSIMYDSGQASTKALQETANISLSSINAKIPSLGQQLGENSMPVVLTEEQLIYMRGRSWNLDSGLDSITVQSLPPAIGQRTINQSLSVTIASDQTVPVSSIDLGVKADAVASSDTGTFSLIAFVKRGLQNWTTLLSRVPAQGQALAASSLPVVLPAAQITTLTPPSNTGYALDGTDATGITQLTGGVGIRGWLSGIFSKLSNPLAVTQSGTWNINNVSGTVSLPTGAATADGLTTINTTLGTPMQNSGGSVGVSSLPALPTGTNTIGSVGISGTPTFNLGTLNGAATEATLSTLNSKVTACDTGAVNNKKSTGFSYGVNKPPVPDIGGNFTTGIYAEYVLVATVPASPTRLNVNIENLSGSPIVIMRDDGTASSGSPPNEYEVFSLEGYYGIGRQGGSWSSNTFIGRLQVYSAISSPQIAIMVD